MIVPIRCFSCGKLIANEYEEYVKRLKKKEDPAKILADLGIVRYCCRRTIFSHVDLMEDIMKYKV